MNRYVLVVVATLVPFGLAQAQIRPLPLKLARSGVPLKLTAVSSINPDCTSRGRSEVRLIAQPSGGQVFTRLMNDYPTLPPTDPAFPCDKRRVPSTVVFYRSSPGYRGSDTVDFQMVFPTGNVRQAHFNIEVE